MKNNLYNKKGRLIDKKSQQEFFGEFIENKKQGFFTVIKNG